MYANEIIEALQDWIKIIKNPLALKHISEIKELVIRSYKYDIGLAPSNPKEVYKLVSPSYDTGVLDKLPHKVILINCQIDESADGVEFHREKIAYLIFDPEIFSLSKQDYYQEIKEIAGKNRVITVVAFYQDPTTKEWTVDPVLLYIWGNNEYQMSLFDLKLKSIEMHWGQKFAIENVTDALRSRSKSLERLKRVHSNTLYMVQYFLLLINCKNIYAERKDHPEKVNKKRIKRGKLPLFSYHILKVRTLKDIRDSDRTVGKESQDHNRVHVCRGHFKTFTSQRPLFGKFSGMFWWEPSVRGRGQGYVDKDYKIEQGVKNGKS